MLFNSIYWLSVTLVFILAIFCGFIIGITDEKKKSRAKWTSVINRAMTDAYNAGYTDGALKNQPRPTKAK